MDDPALDVAAHHAALRGLGRINRVSRTAAGFWPTLRELSRGCTAGRPLRVADLACGGGDVLRQLAAKGVRSRCPIAWTGYDLSTTALAYAQDASAQHRLPIRWMQHDVVRADLPETFDVTLCSLFFHHLSMEDAALALRRMVGASKLVMVSDLRRSATGHLVAAVGTRLLSRSPVVHADGPQSVRAGWTKDELLQIAAKAGCPSPGIRAQFPWRWMMICDASASLEPYDREARR